MTWPADDLTKVHLDSTTDDPSQARAELEALLDKVKLILGEVTTGQIVATLEAVQAFSNKSFSDDTFFDDNLGIGLSTFGGSTNNVIGIAIDGQPTASPVDAIEIYAKGSTQEAQQYATLALQLEDSVESIGTFTPSHKLRIWINGTEYWLQLDAV
jgi:hypothetical protein